MFCARLAYSCAPFAVCFLKANTEAFLGGLCLTSSSLVVGVPRRAIFDNAKVAVKSGVSNCISQWILKREGLGC